MKELIIIFVLTFTCDIYSQSVYNIYKDYLPAKAQNDEQLKNMAVSNLERVLSLHPDIVYSYLYFFDSQIASENKEEIMDHFTAGACGFIDYYNFQLQFCF
jgi:hypothetical protein